jgi:3-oxoacyl-[acyl-carrier-protein] synthase II
VVPLTVGELAVSGLGIAAPGVSDPDGALARLPEAADPDWFQGEFARPGRGYRRLPPATRYLLAAAEQAVGDAGDRWSRTRSDRRAAVVATNNAGAALLEELDTTIIRHGAQELSPLLSPYSTMSSFASRLSVEHGIAGFTLSVNSPATAGLEAIEIACRALAAGRAATVLVSAVEETLSASQSARASQAGAAVLCCRPAAAGPARYGTCRARSAFLDPAAAADGPAVFAGLLGDTPPDRIDAVLEDSAVGTAAARWLDRLAGDCDVVIVPTAAHAGCLTPLHRVVGLLAQEHATRTRRAVLAASAEGTLALAELIVTPRPPNGATSDRQGGP